MVKKSFLAAIAIVSIIIPVSIVASVGSSGQDNSKPRWPGKIIPQLDFASYIKGSYKRIDCLKNNFPTIKWGGKSTSSLKAEEVKDFSNESESWLLVEHYKQNYKSGKWWGEFRLIWSVKDETNKQGLITVINARTYKKWLWGGSSAYLLTKDSDAWNVNYFWESKEGIKVEEGVKRLIPQATSELPGSLNTTNYWGFNPDVNKVHSIEDEEISEKSHATHFYRSWKFSKEENGKVVHSWAKDIQNWWKWIFGWQAIESKMNNIKGSWKENTN